VFCGKVALCDIKTLAQLVGERLVVPPHYLPSQFADLHALSAWMCYTNFLNRLSLERITDDYAGLFCARRRLRPDGVLSNRTG
jgi:hypothetical protein